MEVCDVPVMGEVCDTVEFARNPGEAVTNGIGAWIATSMGDLAASAADLAVKGTNATTRIDLNAAWYRENYELLLPIGLVVTVGTFCLQLMLAAWRRDERALAQAVTGTITGVFFAFAAISLTSIAITVVDALSAGLFQAANTSVDDAIRRLVRASHYASIYEEFNWAPTALMAIGAAIGAFLYWGFMIFRKVGVLILVTLAVFAGAGGGWEAARRWRRGWIEITATLVVSKMVMTIVFLVGVTAIGNSETKGGVAALSDALAGIVVLALVLLCPYASYKFIHWAAEGGNSDEIHRTSAAGVTTAASAAKTAGMYAAFRGRGAAAPQGPARVPGADSNGVVSNISPTSGPAQGAEPQRTTFRYSTDPNAHGGRIPPLIRRPTGPRHPLITRPGQATTAASADAQANVPHPSVPASGGHSPSPSGPSPEGSSPKPQVFPRPPKDDETGS